MDFWYTMGACIFGTSHRHCRGRDGALICLPRHRLLWMLSENCPTCRSGFPFCFCSLHSHNLRYSQALYNKHEPTHVTSHGRGKFRIKSCLLTACMSTSSVCLCACFYAYSVSIPFPVNLIQVGKGDEAVKTVDEAQQSSRASTAPGVLSQASTTQAHLLQVCKLLHT